jgi:hypothetical protein
MKKRNQEMNRMELMKEMIRGDRLSFVAQIAIGDEKTTSEVRAFRVSQHRDSGSSESSR